MGTPASFIRALAISLSGNLIAIISTVPSISPFIRASRSSIPLIGGFIQTRADNARFFGEGERVPTHCVTQGLGTIMEARHVVMVATGRHKARAVTAMIEGPVAAVCPASILQFHPSVLVVVDEAPV